MAEGRAKLWHLALGSEFAGFKLYAYEPGTTTPKTVWADADKGHPYTNPVLADSNGWMVIYGDGDYRFDIQNASGGALRTLDPIRITDDRPFSWDADHGEDLPLARMSEKWRTFLRHDSSDVPLGLYTNDGDKYVLVSTNRGTDFNVMDYGAIGNGVANDSAAIQSAVDAAEAALGRVHIPAGTYLCNGLTVTEPISITGEGRGSRLLSSGPGAMWTFDEGGTQNFEGQNPGVVMADLFLDGNERASGGVGLKLSHLDHSTFRDLWIEEFESQAVWFYQVIRESKFVRIRTRYCGNKETGTPVFDLRELGHGTPSEQDRTNSIGITQCTFAYFFGDAIYAESPIPNTGNRVRNLKITENLFHGPLASGIKFGASTTQQSCRAVAIGNCTEVTVTKNRMSTLGRGTPGIHIFDPAATVDIRENKISEHLGTDSGARHGVLLDAGKMWLYDNTFRAQDPAWETKADSTIYRDDSNQYDLIGASTYVEAAGSTPEYEIVSGVWGGGTAGYLNLRTRDAAGALINRMSFSGDTDGKQWKIFGFNVQFGSAVPTHTTDLKGAPLASVNFYVRDALDGAITVDQVIYVTIDGGITWSPLTTT